MMDANAIGTWALVASGWLLAALEWAYTAGRLSATRRDLDKLKEGVEADGNEVWHQINHIKDHYARRDDLTNAIDGVRQAIKDLDTHIRDLVLGRGRPS